LRMSFDQCPSEYRWQDFTANSRFIGVNKPMFCTAKSITRLPRPNSEASGYSDEYTVNWDCGWPYPRTTSTLYLEQARLIIHHKLQPDVTAKPQITPQPAASPVRPYLQR
jgi:hypothetical protein